MLDEVLRKTLVDVLVAALVIAIPIVVRSVFVFLNSQKELIEAQLSAEQVSLIKELAKVAVNSAEVYGLQGIVTDKKNYTVNWIRDYILTNTKFNVPVSVIADMVEAAVWQEINQYIPEKNPQLLGK